MIHLILYIVFSSVFTLCIKWVHNRGTEDILTVGAINYIVAAIGIAPWVLSDGQQTGDGYAMLTGGTMGLVYFIAFFFVIYAVRLVGASATTVVGVLSISMAIAVGALVWDSVPTTLQFFGIGLALFSLCLIGVKPEPEKIEEVDGAEGKLLVKQVSNKVAPLILLAFFILCGMSRICQEAFNQLSEVDQKPTFLITAFLVTALPSIIMLVVRRKKVLPVEILTGIIMGVSNAAQTFFILRSLDMFPGYIVFTVTSAGAIIFTMLIATQFLGERLSKRMLVGIGVAVLALGLLNWNVG